MRRPIILACVALLVGTALADGTRRYRGMRHYTYDYQSGRVTPRDAGRNAPRHNPTIWFATTTEGEFLPADSDTIISDWGDANSAHCIGLVQIAYATSIFENVDGSSPLDADIVFFEGDNGFDSPQRLARTALRLTGLPVVPFDANLPPDGAMGFTVDISGFEPFHIDGPDLDPGAGTIDPLDKFGLCRDTRGLSDFGYSMHFRSVSAGVVGPILAEPIDPNVSFCSAPGVYDAVDRYGFDINQPPADPDAILIAGIDYPYVDSPSFGGEPFAQVYLSLGAYDPNDLAGCSSGACHIGDIWPIGGDCVVDLNDLVAQLSNFGMPSGARRFEGNIEPAGPDDCGVPLNGDGDVDLLDLTVMLSLFGTDCR